MTHRISDDVLADWLAMKGAATGSANWERSLAAQEIEQSRALISKLREDASSWHRLVESFATIMEIDSTETAEHLGISIAEKIRSYQGMESKLRELAERMREFDSDKWDKDPSREAIHEARQETTMHWLESIEFMLSAQPEEQKDHWSQLAMLTNDQMRRAIDAKLACCLGGQAAMNCHDCPELSALLSAHGGQP